MMKMTKPPRKTLRRLQRSESLAKIGMLAVDAMTYALMTKVPPFGAPELKQNCRKRGEGDKLIESPHQES